MRILSLNTTTLTKDRLVTLLQHAMRRKVHVVTLQETKHHTLHVQWAAQLGWKACFSTPSPLDRLNRRRAGGTAIFWLNNHSFFFRKVASVRNLSQQAEAHRAVEVCVCSAYGPAQAPDGRWFNQLIHSASAPQKPCTIVVGDFIWKPAYDGLIPADWRSLDHVATTDAGTAPTRAIATCPVIQASAEALPGIPFHHATLFEVSVDAPDETCSASRSRLRRAASYEWINPKPPKATLKNILDCGKQNPAFTFNCFLTSFKMAALARPPFTKRLKRVWLLSSSHPSAVKVPFPPPVRATPDLYVGAHKLISIAGSCAFIVLWRRVCDGGPRLRLLCPLPFKGVFVQSSTLRMTPFALRCNVSVMRLLHKSASLSKFRRKKGAQILQTMPPSTGPLPKQRLSPPRFPRPSLSMT